MRMMLLAALIAPISLTAFAQTKPVATGDPSVAVESKSASTAGDVNTGGNQIIGGSSNVMIGGKPAGRVGDKTDCGGTVVTGSSSVFINGKPMATSGSLTTDCATTN